MNIIKGTAICPIGGEISIELDIENMELVGNTSKFVVMEKDVPDSFSIDEVYFGMGELKKYKFISTKSINDK